MAFNVLCNYTAMLGRIKLTDEQREAIADGGKKRKTTIHANAPQPTIGMADLIGELQAKKNAEEAEAMRIEQLNR